MEKTECGAAALSMVLGAHGRFVPLAALREACGVTRDGSTAISIVRAARRYGMMAKGVRKEPGELASLPMPAILYWRFSHFVVLEGFRRGRIFINDPATGPRTVTRAEFDGAFTGIALVFTPGPDFTRGGAPPRLSSALRRRLRGSRLDLAYLVMATLALAVPSLFVPLLLQIFVDHYLAAAQPARLWPVVCALGAAAAASLVLIGLQRRVLLMLENKLALVASSSLLWHLVRLPMAFYQQRLGSELASRAALNDRIARVLSGRLPLALLNLVTIAAYAGVMFAYDLRLAALSVSITALNLAILGRVSRLREDSRRRLLAERGRLIGTSVVGLQMIESLKAGGGQTDYLARWAEIQANIIDAEQKLGVATQGLLVLPALLAALNALAVLIIGGVRVMDGTMSYGMLAAFQALVAGLAAPSARLVGLGAQLQELKADSDRLDDIYEHAPDSRAAAEDDDGPASAIEPAKLSGRVELHGVSFGYDRLAPPLIAGFDLTLKPGTRVALVGRTGSGKSTIAQLVAGLSEPWSGAIRYDGRARAQIPTAVFAHSLAVVHQEPCLFAGTVHENLTLWDPEAEMEVVVRAARDACIHEVILARAGGYDAPVGEAGMNFSGGERQRLELARALAIDPSILILDEATSALDPTAEQAIDDNLRRRGCTCLIIAHRLSTIRDCDEIIVLEAGRVVERGAHDALIAAGGAYARLIAAELSATEPDGGRAS